MANAFLNPVAVPGMWGDNIPAPAPLPAVTRNPVAPATDTFDNAHSVVTKPKAVAWVRMAPDILRAMAVAAKHAGRTAGDVWAEAARDWLLRKSLEADYDALANMPQRRRDSAALEAKHARLWGSIDAAMSDIRQLRPTL